MRRTSFVGALIVITVGGVLAFAIQASPKWLDLQAAGLIIMVAGVADLVIRFLLGDSPLLSPETADVAAVVEPLGEPVLDVFGNPIMTAAHPHVLQPPPLEVPVAYDPEPAPDSLADDGTGTITGQTLRVPRMTAPDDTQDIPVVEGPTEILRAADPMERYASHDRAIHDQVVRQAGDYQQPSSLAPVSALTGRPVRSAWRRRRH